MADQAPIYVCVARTPDGEKHLVTLVPPGATFARGLPPEAIVGVLLRPLGEGESITPEVFARNSVFVRFLHDVIGRQAPLQPDCRDEAARLGSGWVYVIDQRTRTPRGAVPPCDIMGAMQASGGSVVLGSYQPNPQHLILSADGFFRLSPPLHDCLMRELTARAGAGGGGPGRSPTEGAGKDDR